jgi:hypothetical protein
MRALVVYETEYGNSEKVVRAIAEAFGEHGEAAWCPPQPVSGWSARDRRELDEALLREGQALEERAEELESVAGVRPKTRLIQTEPAPVLPMAAEEGGREEGTLIAVASRGLGATCTGERIDEGIEEREGFRARLPHRRRLVG